MTNLPAVTLTFVAIFQVTAARVWRACI